MKPEDSAWLRLTNAARQGAPASENEQAPFGFSTRMAALAAGKPSARPSWQSGVSFAGWRALGVALVLMLLSIAANYSSMSNVAETDQESVVDPVADLLASS